MQLRKLVGKTLAILLLLQPLLFAQSASGFRFHSGQNPLVGFFQSFWKLADVNDSLSTQNLTNVNTVTFGAGHIGNAATFVRTSNQALNHANATALQFGNQKWTVAVWFKRTSTTANQYIVGKMAAAEGSGEMFLRANNGAETVSVVVYNGGSTQRASCGPTSLANNSYHLGVIWFDSTEGTNGTLHCAFDGGAPSSSAASGALAVCATCLWSIGGLSGGANALDGQVDAVGWRQGAIPTTAQQSALWAAGAGWEP